MEGPPEPEQTEGPRAAERRLQMRRSTWAGLAGIAAVAVAVLLTLAHVGGNVLPTVLAIAGVGSLMAGVATGSMQIADAFRYSRDAPLYDDDEKDDRA